MYDVKIDIPYIESLSYTKGRKYADAVLELLRNHLISAGIIKNAKFGDFPYSCGEGELTVDVNDTIVHPGNDYASYLWGFNIAISTDTFTLKFYRCSGEIEKKIHRYINSHKREILKEIEQKFAEIIG